MLTVIQISEYPINVKSKGPYAAQGHIKNLDVPYQIVTCKPYEVETVRATLTGWTLELYVDESLPDASHPASLSIPRLLTGQDCVTGSTALQAALDGAFKDCQAVVVPVVWAIEGGKRALNVTLEPRLKKAGVAFNPDAPVAVLASFPIVRVPTHVQLLESGDHNRAEQLALAERVSTEQDPYSVKHRLAQRTHVISRFHRETDDAAAALETLFNYMSRYEELSRLDQIMALLPYGLEAHPKVEKLKELLRKQIGHLSGGEVQWYSEGSPAEAVNDASVEHPVLIPRLDWLAQQCKELGLKRVVEFGSVDGVSLFPLLKFAPEVEWHGLEVNPKAVEHGKMLTAKFGVENFNLHHVRNFAEATSVGVFDAAFVFDVLEHNSYPVAVLLDAIRVVKPGGWIFITTPNGAWSPFHEATRELTLRKDHINAFTVARMKALLETLEGVDSIQAFEVENPNWWEANGWVFAKFRVQ